MRQAPRAWNKRLNKILVELKFKKCAKDPSVYRKVVNNQLLVVDVYVDDLFVNGTDKKVIDEFKHGMALKFNMSDIEKLTYYLGIEVYQHAGGIRLNQKRYTTRILEEAGMLHISFEVF